MLNIKDNSGEGSEIKESQRENLCLLREYMSNQERNVGRNMDIKGHFGEVAEGKEEHAIGNWRKGSPCYKLTKNMAELCFSILCRVELTRNKIGYLAEEISKQSVEGVARFLLTACFSKM